MTDASLPSIDRPFEAEASFGDYVSLLKPRVMSLVVFTALAGLVAAPVHPHPFVAMVAILCIAVGGGASGALNMWWDADIDLLMRRTRSRAVPSGRVEPGEALGLGLGLSGLSVMLLGLATNWLAAGLLLFTILFYALVYTMWLKRRTPQNIVIGGLAGALPPLVAWVAATGSVAWAPVLMVLVIFTWTPPHFWALALFMKGDYGRASVPMLTETHGDRTTRRHVLAYAVLLVPVTLLMALSSAGGPLTLAATAVLGAMFVASALRLWARDRAAAEADGWAAERATFRLSLLFLFVVFAALMADAALGLAWGQGAWVFPWVGAA